MRIRIEDMIMKLATCAVALAILGPVVGCTGHRDAGPGECQVSHDAATRTKRALRQDPANIPVIVRSRFKPDPLTTEQLYEIVDRAERATDDERAIWFIALLRNELRNEERSWAVNVYLAPDGETPRIRKGRMLAVDSRWIWKSGSPEVAALKQFLRDEGITNYAKPNLPTYVQVSEAEKPFHQELEVPSGTGMPLLSPEGLDDTELIDIFDFVRTLCPSELPANSTVSSDFLRYFKSNAAIVRIERNCERIKVRYAVSETDYGGMGTFIDLMRKSCTFRIVDSGIWAAY